jgi:hypothetical protein
VCCELVIDSARYERYEHYSCHRRVRQRSLGGQMGVLRLGLLGDWGSPRNETGTGPLPRCHGGDICLLIKTRPKSDQIPGFVCHIGHRTDRQTERRPFPSGRSTDHYVMRHLEAVAVHVVLEVRPAKLEGTPPVIALDLTVTNKSIKSIKMALRRLHLSAVYYCDGQVYKVETSQKCRIYIA